MRLLRVMYFKGIMEYSRHLLFVTEYPVNLRFLVTPLMPLWIEKLINLEYLLVQSRVCITPTIVKMNKLRYIHAHSAYYSEDWSSCSESSSLEYMSCLEIRNAKDEEFLKRSPLLRKLRCIYLVHDPSSTKMKHSHPHFDMRFLTHLDSLDLRFLLACNLFKLEEFGFPSNIRKLTLCHIMLSSEMMSIVGRLEKVEVLKLLEMLFVGGRWDTREDEFQKLRFLELKRLYNLSQLNVASYDHFPKLQQLVLTDCSKLEEICSEIGEITTLELIAVTGKCRNSLVESVERIRDEQHDLENESLKFIIERSDWNGEEDESENEEMSMTTRTCTRIMT